MDARNGEYEAFGVPATILANFLRENGVVPEKCDLNSILFLLTPAEDMAKLQQLVALLVRFENCWNLMRRWRKCYLPSTNSMKSATPVIRFVSCAGNA
ncbi:hypothetical protein FA039_06530 [Escherichia coli]|nr:hypothetical protein [Escherichia coli]